jgi:hypothetical protein
MEEIYKTYLTWDKAKTLTEKGFDEPCAGTCINTKSDPLYGFFDKPQKVDYAKGYTQAAFWIALRYKLFVSVKPKQTYPENEYDGGEWHISIKDRFGDPVHTDDGTYEYHEGWNNVIGNAIDLIHEIDCVHTYKPPTDEKI